ncbi:hypothetical protein FRB90_004165 [Tulasnella sp. 427]|nr:hypothetical protein FRB90_004165 [Tulasnella sp. 427]
MSTNTRPMSPGPSTRPSSAPRPPEGPKADMDSAFKRSGLGQKKADNPFKTPAAPTATPTSSVPNSSTNKPPADSHDSNSILPREPPVQSQKPAWKPVRLSPPSGPSKSESPVVAPPSLDKGKGKEMEIDVSSAPRAVATAPDVVAMSPSEPARVTKEEWLKKIRLLVAAVEMRAKQLDIKSELNNLKRLEERYSVRGEQNQEGRKRLVEELDKKVAAEKAAVANLKELCFRLASGAPGDDEPELQPESNDNDRQRAAEAKEERKRLMETLKQVQADVQQVANNVQGTATILAQHRADVAALSSRKAAHDADGDVNMDAMQIAAGSSSSAQPNPATDPSIRRDIVELKRRIELIEQGLEDARAEVEDARVVLVAKIDSLETSTSGDQNQDQESAASQANLVERVKALENNLGLVVNEVVRLDETTSAMSLAKLRAQNVKLQERLAEVGVF